MDLKRLACRIADDKIPAAMTAKEPTEGSYLDATNVCPHFFATGALHCVSLVVIFVVVVALVVGMEETFFPSQDFKWMFVHSKVMGKKKSKFLIYSSDTGQ